jgi:hypothetical protein
MKTISGSSSMTVARFASALAIVGCAALAPSVARAAEPGHARADALFREGRALLDAKKYDEACPKLAESQKMEPGSGTLLALAMCHEGQGKTATAHRELLETAALARRNGRQDLAAAAEKRAKAMEPSLTRLVVRLPDDEGASYSVKLDDQPLADDARGKAIVVDPGEHRVVASAQGRVARSYVVRATGGTVEIVVDQLDEEEKAAPAAAPPKPARAPAPRVTDEELTHASGQPERESGSSGTTQRVIGITLIGGGVAGLVGGGVFGAQAVSARSDARQLSGPAAEAANDRAKDKTMGALICGSAGVVALAVGTILVVTAPSSGKKSPTVGGGSKLDAQLVPIAGPTQLGAGFEGTF